MSFSVKNCAAYARSHGRVLGEEASQSMKTHRSWITRFHGAMAPSRYDRLDQPRAPG